MYMPFLNLQKILIFYKNKQLEFPCNFPLDGLYMLPSAPKKVVHVFVKSVRTHLKINIFQGFKLTAML